MSAAAAMALVATNAFSPPLLGKSDGKAKASLQAKAARSKAFMVHFQALSAVKNGEPSTVYGPAQEDYDNRAYPATAIAPAQMHAASKAAKDKENDEHGHRNNWQELGPSGVPADAIVAGESTHASAGTIYSGRATAIVVSPNCRANKGDRAVSRSDEGDCKIFIGAAGGGVWAADNALASQPNWHPSNNGIPSNAIGSIIFDPTDRHGRTLYVGTGEPNGSSDSEAGVGLYKSTDAGKSWTLVSGSSSVSTNRSIGAIAIDPVNASHIFIGTDVARHGSSSVNGGRFTPPGAPTVGLYESTNGGATFTLVFSQPSDTPNGGTTNGADFFRGGVSHIELYRPGTETQVYASLFDYGVFRRSRTLDGDTKFHQIFGSNGGGDIGLSSIYRTEFSLAPNGSNLRIYVGDGGTTSQGTAPPDTTQATFWRVDNANVSAATLFTGGTNGGWIQLSNSTPGTPGFGSYSFCEDQCSYDMPVYSPPGAPNIVYIGGAMHYEEIFTVTPPSNGRAVQRSEDAGVHFTDMTVDTPGVSLHPDQHAITTAPLNPNIVFIGNDGGLWRLNGSFTDVSSQCSSRGISGADLTDCQMWLAKVPTTISSLNDGLGTLQYQSLSINPHAPRTDIMGGTQDNGTHAFSSKGGEDEQGNGSWFVTIFGDGGQSGTDAVNPNNRFHTFFDAQIDVNFNGTNELGWDWVSDTFFVGAASGEGRSFYIPIIHDPVVGGTIFTGLTHVWRTQDNGGNQAFLDQHCTEFGGDLPFTGACGDWVALGGPRLTSTTFGSDKQPSNSSGYIVRVSRAPSDTGTLWAGLRRGRVFVTSNADAASPGAVTFYRIDTSAQPTRFVSGIDPDQSKPNHVFISYSGYNAYATATGTATGHVFEVTYNPVTHVATWSGDLAGGDPSTGGLGDQPITGIAVDWHRGDVYVSTDFGVYMRKSGNTNWQPAGGNLPPVAVYGLTIDVNTRVLYAATHGRGAWRLDLSDRD